MSESEYFTSEIADADLDALADAGDFRLDEEAFQYRLTPVEIAGLVKEGNLIIAHQSLGQTIELGN
jgi:hypothetical protein